MKQKGQKRKKENNKKQRAVPALGFGFWLLAASCRQAKRNWVNGDEC